MKRVSICDNFVHGRLRTSSDTYTKALWSLTTATLGYMSFQALLLSAALLRKFMLS